MARTDRYPTDERDATDGARGTFAQRKRTAPRITADIAQRIRADKALDRICGLTAQAQAARKAVRCVLCDRIVDRPDYAHAWDGGTAHGVCIIELREDDPSVTHEAVTL
jgi:hypothetical protein